MKVQSVVFEIMWVESCYCHPQSDNERNQHLPGQHRHGKAHAHQCSWSGRRIVEIAMGRPNLAMQSTIDANSPELMQMLNALLDEQRGEFLSARDIFVVTITEEWTFKFNVTTQYPIRFLKVMCPYFGGTLAESKLEYQRAITWYDTWMTKLLAHNVWRCS